EPLVRHPEIGAMVARYCAEGDADLPSFIQMGIDGGESSPNAGSGYLGPAFQPFRLGQGGRLPENTTPYLGEDAEHRRRDLLRFLEENQQHSATQLQAYRQAQERSYRLLRSRGVFDVSAEWANARDRYGDTNFGRNVLTARRLVEAGVPFVEVEQPNYD